jgi:hypothetical protein
MSTTMFETDAWSLRARLKRLAEVEAEKAGLSPSMPCWGLLTRMLAIGIQRMEQHKLLKRPDKVQLAEENVCLFVKHLTARAKNDGRFPIADENAFAKAKVGAGQLWPFF